MKLRIFFTVCIILVLTSISPVSAQQVFVPDDPSLFYQFIEKADHNKVVITKDFPGSWSDIKQFSWRIEDQYDGLRFYVVVDSMLILFDMNFIHIFYPSGRTERSIVFHIDQLGVLISYTEAKQSDWNYTYKMDVEVKLALNYVYSSPRDTQNDNVWKEFGISMVNSFGKKVPMFEGEKLELTR
jgi:hypothetical protein